MSRSPRIFTSFARSITGLAAMLAVTPAIFGALDTSVSAASAQVAHLQVPLADVAPANVSYQSNFKGQRTWVGPDYWTIRWQDWSVNGQSISVEARANRSAALMTHEVKAGDGTLRASIHIRADEKVSTPAGFWLGVNGPIPDWRSSAAYADYRAFAGVRPDGALVIRDRKFSEHIFKATTLDLAQPFQLILETDTQANQVNIQIKAIQNNIEAGAARLSLPADSIQGLVALGTIDHIGEPLPRNQPATRWHFSDFNLSGSLLAFHPDRTFGPIGWTQYFVDQNVLKMSVMMMPVGETENQKVQLQLDRGQGYETVAEESMHPLSRSAHFRVASIDTTRAIPYRVRYLWNDQEHFYNGTLRAAPQASPQAPNAPINIAVLNCDRGYVFPNLPIVANLKHRNPDMILYLGDQFYEPAGNHGIERRPLDRSSLDYLRKYALFGWANRDLLANTPSIIIPDDHDVFQGNVWGAGGRKVPPGGDEMGGYQGEGEWINIVMRTQSWHLPDAYDPTPIEQDITVHYTDFTFGGVSFAVFEDRKWKTGFRSIWPTGESIPRTDLDALDHPGAVLLGERQEKFLADWASRDTDKVKVAISQTIFAKSYTHTGPELKKNNVDLDTNGWPRTPRNRAVSTLGKARALHLVGDQHIGILSQLGVETWTDGPLTFMATGTANGWPRAWWPDTPGENRLPGDPENTGRYIDVFGNQMTIHAVVNPEPGSHLLTAETHTQYQIADAKSSGFGLVSIDPNTQHATFNMYRFNFDPNQPEAARQFDGFPITFKRTSEGWLRITP